MTGRPQRRHFIKWVPKAWRGDLELRSCSLAARGLWAELLMVMHDCEPYGHLVVNGRAPDVEAIGRLVGASPAETKRLLAELEAARVFSRTTEGVIYSRRFVEDERAYVAACANGSKGGNPSLKRDAPLAGGITPGVGDTDNAPLRARAGARSPVRVSESEEAGAPSVLPPDPPAKPARRILLEPDWTAHPGLDTPAMRAAWETWSAHRRGLKSKPWTAPGLAQCFAELAAMGPERAIAAIQHSVARNYAGIYEPKGDVPRGGPAQAPTPQTSIRAMFEAEARARDSAIDVPGRRTA